MITNLELRNMSRQELLELKEKIEAILKADEEAAYNSVSIFDTYKEAKKEADGLNKLPDPIGVKDPKNHVTKCVINY